MKNKHLWALAAAAMMLAASCQDESEIAAPFAQQTAQQQAVADSNKPEASLITFTAGDGDATLQKAAYANAASSGKIIWQAGDKISIYRLSAKSDMELISITADDLGGDASSCKFSVSDGMKDENGYFAIYPGTTEPGKLYNTSNPTGYKLESTTIPTAQTVKANQFDPQADIMVAYATDEDRHFDFKHLVTKLGITVPVDGVKRIKINCSQSMAGKTDVIFPTESNSIPLGSRYYENSITLTCGDDEGFQKNSIYYACLAPLPENCKVEVLFFTEDSDIKEISYIAGFSGGLKRATRNLMDCTNPSAKQHKYIRLDDISKLGIQSDQTVKGANKIVFDYAVNHDASKYGTPTEIEGIQKYVVSTAEGKEVYFLSDYDIVMPEDISFMFQECDATSIDLLNFHTEKVFYTNYMFQGCAKLVTLDISGFKYIDWGDICFDNYDNIEGMFAGCRELTTIYACKDFCDYFWRRYAQGWDQDDLWDQDAGPNMFYDCDKLEGGKGSTRSTLDPPYSCSMCLFIDGYEAPNGDTWDGLLTDVAEKNK